MENEGVGLKLNILVSTIHSNSLLVLMKDKILQLRFLNGHL